MSFQEIITLPRRYNFLARTLELFFLSCTVEMNLFKNKKSKDFLCVLIIFFFFLANNQSKRVSPLPCFEKASITKTDLSRSREIHQQGRAGQACDSGYRAPFENSKCFLERSECLRNFGLCDEYDGGHVVGGS